MDKIKLVLIKPEEVDNIFPIVANYLENAVKKSNDEITLESVLQDLYTGFKQLWIIRDDKFKINGTCVTEISNYPNKRVVRIILLGGKKMDEWTQEVSDTISNWGKTHGATRVEVIGRKGWARVLEKHGYKLAYFHLIKEV